MLRNEFRREDGTLIAVVSSAGGWLDLGTRTLVAPPAALLEAMRALPRAVVWLGYSMRPRCYPLSS